MNTSDSDPRSRVLLSVQQALVGEVTPQMRYIGVEYSLERIHIIVWNDGEIDESISADFDACAVTKAIAEFAWPERGDPPVSFEFVRCDFPQRPHFRGTVVFGRWEASAV